MFNAPTRRAQLLRWSMTLALALIAPAALAQWISPGPLAEGHAKIDDVASCEKCHAPGKRVEATRCLACHTEVGIPLMLGRGYHARLIRESGKTCESCHSDHHGRSYPLIRWSPPAGFDHGKEIGFALTGAHASIACESCHKNRPRYMGEKTACVACHKDVHGNELGVACESCHDTTAFKPASRFDHGKTKFPLENRHVGVACESCHKPSAQGTVRFEVKNADRCSSCHGDPHGGRTALSPCTSCHTTRGWKEVSNVPPAHSPAGWPLVGKHDGVACTDCHGPSLTAKVSKTCASCHEDVHAGRFGNKCESCHDEGGWKQVKLSGFDHGKTRYPLEGRHQQVRCEKCHRAVGGKTTWKGVAFDRCDRCHRPWHEETFAGPARATECEACHTVQGFSPSTFTSSEHQHARFHLDGSHLAVPCESCHVRAPPKPTPLAIGVKSCADCHKDPHAGQFDAQMVDGKSCAACHSTAGWAKDAFDHDATAFPLRGVHAAAACDSCHVGDPVQYKGLPTTCEGCHRDPHLGQLAARACTTCHNEAAWAIKPFDHAGLTTFALDGRHAPLACEACHDTRTLADGTTVTHYNLGYQACADCHANPHRGKRSHANPNAKVPDIGGACETCHTPSDWRVLPAKVAFDHALTGFALDGRHASATCTDCHGKALKTGDTRSACTSCHEDEHRGELGKSCESCHDARSWDPSAILVNHRATAFPLVGAHAAADCTACHDTTRQDRWTRPAADCYSCHARDYQRNDIHPNHVAAGFSRNCDTCHAQDSFSPARVHHDIFWPLRGAHASAECFQCHVGERYGNTPRACVGCHQDDYLAAADPPHAAFAISERCESCHTEIAWPSVKPTWHDRLFPISHGNHARFSCGDCHFGQTQPPANFTCIGCHGQSETSRHHGDVSAFVWENFACYACHPGGTAD